VLRLVRPQFGGYGEDWPQLSKLIRLMGARLAIHLQADSQSHLSGVMAMQEAERGKP
jgi:hypothetical protein